MESRRVRVGTAGGRNDFAELELDPVVGDADDTTAADVVSGGDIEFLPDASAKHLREMVGVGTDQSSVTAGDFVGDPAAAGHGCENVSS